MRVLTSGILTGAKIWLLILAVAIGSLALAPGSHPADATGQPGQTNVFFSFSETNPIRATNIVLAANGEPRKVYVWVENPKDLDWGSGVGAYEIDLQYDPTLVTLTAAEWGEDCNDALDNDGDTVINDGCPQAGSTREIDQCYNNVDDDGDGFINDGCPMLAPPAEPIELCWDGLDNETERDGAPDDGCPVDLELGDECLNTTDDDGDTFVNDGCPTDEKPESGAECANAADDDFDVFINDGCPPDGSEVGAQCDNSTDDDGDGFVNDGCLAVGPGAETGIQCDNALDDDGDGKINDGCVAVGVPEAGPACANALDDDVDGKINDGCPQLGPEETGADCGNAADDDGDGKINDGCAERSSSEAGGQCLDAVDNDGDSLVNDGCPPKGAPEFACNDAVDDDGDGWYNDGCPPKGSVETAFQCGNDTDDDGDTVVNDGCPQRGPVAVGNEDWLGLTGRAASCGTAYTRKVAGQDLWHFNLSCSTLAPPGEADQGVQVSGLLTSFWLLPGSQFGSGPFSFTGSSALRTPGHIKVVEGVPTLKETAEIPFNVLSALVQITRCGSIDGDNVVSFLDFLVMLQHFNEVDGVSPGWDKAIDLDADGAIAFLDFLLMLAWFNRACEPWP